MAIKKTKSKSGRQYSKYDQVLQATRTEVIKRSSRNKARAMMVEKYWAAAVRGKDVNHIKPLSEWGKTVLSNLEIIDRAKNRAKKPKSMKKKTKTKPTKKYL